MNNKRVPQHHHVNSVNLPKNNEKLSKYLIKFEINLPWYTDGVK